MTKNITLILIAIVLLNIQGLSAKIRGNIPATYIEGRELSFRFKNLHSTANPLTTNVVVKDVSGNDLTINLPLKIAKGGKKATLKIPSISGDTKVSFEVFGGIFPKDQRFKYTMLIIDDPNFRVTGGLDNGDNGTTTFPTVPAGSTLGLSGSEGPQGPVGPTGATGATGLQGLQGLVGQTGNTGATGPQGSQGIQGPVGPAATTMPGAGVVGPVDNSLQARLLNNTQQTLSLTGLAGANVTLSAPITGAINLNLPNHHGTLATLDDLTPVATSADIDIEGLTVIDVTNINFVRIIDSGLGTVDLLETLTGGKRGQRLVLELNKNLDFEADNLSTTNTIQWGRGTTPGQILHGYAGEQYEFVYNGTAWYLFSRFTL